MADDPIDYSRLEAGRDCNYWKLDESLRFAAEQAYPAAEWDWAEDRLTEWGRLVGEEIAENSAVVDRHGPELHTYDRDGNVQNEVEYHPLQLENEELTYGFGVVADAFAAPPDREEPTGLLHHLLQNGLLSFADPGFACPVAMTGGAALVLEKFADESPNPDLLREYYDGLTARDADEYLEGAMFLTEKQGGSDVGANETVAEPAGEEGVYHLRGEKWFCSNIDAEGTLVLARRPDAPEGTAGLSLFLVPHTTRDGDLNDQVYRRLKDKLGTISVPTGEVELHGAEGYLVGEPERGFKYMTEMLNLERLHNAFASVGIMGRALLESKVQAANREAFGQPIQEFPLMRRDLVDMAVDYEAAVAFTFEAAQALDRREAAGEDTDDHQEAFRLVRTLVPVAKYKTGRMAVDTASYACEVLGGNGYVTGFGTERLLRDAQVLPIWEGTSNILSLDLLRALDREDAHEALLPFVSEKLDAVSRPELADILEQVEDAYVALQESLFALGTADRDYAQHEAKQLADLVFDVVTAATLLDHAQTALETDDDARKALVTRWFVRTRFEQSLDRGITNEDSLPDEQYDAIVRYASADPSVLETPASPAD
ncbi:acyl-CoA dehydrogenase family protein [Halobacteriales archaeon Cl-PHB]